ncbi:18S rRNA maturation protein [Linderina pennispora]|nr:18S rRNA maturation protein [Linderina pennispora]
MPRYNNDSAERGDTGSRPYTKQRKQLTNKLTERKLPTSVSACKKQLRDITRLAQRATLPSTKKVELERRIKALNVHMEQMTNAEVNKKNAKRYHHVKFFERKKVMRKLAKAEKQGDDDAVEELMVSLNYTTYYPDEQKYISLYPTDPSKTPEEAKQQQAKIRELIAVAMENGDLPKDPRRVKAEDRKTIRRANRSLLRSVSLASGQEAAESGSEGSGDETGEDADPQNIEEDEFFA